MVDPSALDLIVSLEKRGIRCRKGDNGVQEGIRAVTSALPDLTIDPACTHTIEEHEGYHYPAGNTEKDAPVKANDHTCDMLRYVVMDLRNPEGPVFAASPDEVAAFFGSV